MQVLHSCAIRVWHTLEVAAVVALHVCVVNFGGTVKGLVDISNVMDNHA